ncbi:hypothetical protein ACFL0G_05385 [Candidatus Zixiibacteriota bacterium]
MQMFAKILVILAMLGFVLAVIGVYTNGLAGVTAEGFSRGATNLALIAIALMFLHKGSKKE